MPGFPKSPSVASSMFSRASNDSIKSSMVSAHRESTGEEPTGELLEFFDDFVNSPAERHCLHYTEKCDAFKLPEGGACCEALKAVVRNTKDADLLNAVADFNQALHRLPPFYEQSVSGLCYKGLSFTQRTALAAQTLCTAAGSVLVELERNLSTALGPHVPATSTEEVTALIARMTAMLKTAEATLRDASLLYIPLTQSPAHSEDEA